MRKQSGLLVAVAVAATLGLAVGSQARSAFPSVRELQSALGLAPGQLLPKLVVVRGAVYQPVYRRAEERSDGEYAVIVRLERSR